MVGSGRETVLFVDEVHRFSKAQQDALLPGVENRWVTLVAATTENPSFSVISPLLSRSLLLRLQSLDDDDIREVVDRAVVDERGLAGRFVARRRRPRPRRTAGRGRRPPGADLPGGGRRSRATADRITLETAETAADQAAVRYDRDGDQHYDVISAFIKSVRGSDADAALHYLARMLEAGEDPRFIARRLMILASEDIGLADPTALPTAVAAAQTVQLIGMPEAQLTLAHATIALAVAPKSNAVTTAIGAAIADVRAGKIGTVPPHLRDAHYPGASKLGHGKSYVYSHDEPFGVAEQQYAPDVVAGRRLLPADRPRRRGRGEAALGAGAADHPGIRLTDPGRIGLRPMTSALVVPGWLAVLTVLLVVGLVVAVGWLAGELRRTRDQGEAVLASAAADVDALREELDALQVRLHEEAEQLEEARRTLRLADLTIVDDKEYRITALGERRGGGPLALVPTVPGPQFVDTMLRESLIRTASIAAGLRRALAPEVRNRIRFEMKREVKRSRKQRKADVKQARREWEARQRAAIPASEVSG